MRKGTLDCFLFGHVFLRNDGEWDYPWDFCNKCGLSKNEVLNSK